MKNNISCVFRQGMAVLVAALMAFGTSSISRAAGAETGRYDGETLFRGLFFGIGPVADLFPEIWDSSVVRSYRESGQFLPETQSKAIEEALKRYLGTKGGEAKKK